MAQKDGPGIVKQALVQWLKNQSVLVSGNLNVNGEKDRKQLDSSTVCDLATQC